MGFNGKELCKPISTTVSKENFFNKTIAFDAYNSIFQFLHIIKDRNNKYLRNSKGQITSHISGLFYRNTKFLSSNIKPIYCFDGREKEKKLRWGKNKSKNSVDLNKDMIKRSKKLLDFMGINWIQAPGEGEAQCVKISQDNLAWGIATQDYDVLLYGGERLLIDFAIGRTRKKGNTRIRVKPKFISLKKLLKFHKIKLENLIDFSIMTGNDYFQGLRGIGQKTALSYIKKYNFKEIPEMKKKEIELKDKTTIKKEEMLEIYKKIKKLFLKPKIKENYKIKKKKANVEKLREFLCEENDFSYNRVKNSIESIKKYFFTPKQTTILDF